MKTPFSQVEAKLGIMYLENLFRNETGHGTQMVGDAVGVLADRDEVILSSVLLAQDLIDTTKE